MSRYLGAAGYAHGSRPALGVLITNLGTPDAPTPRALRRYLAEFLWDPRVVEIPRSLWWLILHGVILRTRPRRSARLYEKIWTEAGSPLLVHSQRQAQALAALLHMRFAGPVEVALGMRYGNPSIEQGLLQLRAANAQRILVLPLYPQYSAAATASTFDAVSAVLQRWRWLPELRMVNHYHDDPGYITALAESIDAFWREHGRGDRLLFSFHGIPKRSLLAGDPYHCECHKTARLVAEALGLDDAAWQVTFQSRFGRAEWLQPYTSETLHMLPVRGIKRVDVVCPGFAADCLETLEEIEHENRAVFMQAGGAEYHYIPALNDRPAHIEALAELVARHTAEWSETIRDVDEQALAESARRARALGAEH